MINFQKVADAVAAISYTPSTLEKERLLRTFADIEGFKHIMKFIYNPYITTGIKASKLDNADMGVRIVIVEEFLDYFSVSRTGTQSEVNFAYDFITSSEDEMQQWLATGMATKNLQTGVSVTTLNKVYGKGFIPIIGIMRGVQAPEHFSDIYIATEKIDGNRRLIMVKDDCVEVYTRSGRRDTGLVEIEEQARCLPPGYVCDTELAAVGDYADSIELRQATASIANSKGVRTGAKALVFDMIKQADYDNGISRLGALGRKTLLAAVMRDTRSVEYLHAWFTKYDMEHGTNYSNSVNALSRAILPASETPNIMALPILGIVRNREEALDLAQPIWDTGGEGLMLVQYMSPYEVNPNPRKTLLKIKATKEFTCRCIDVLEGTNKYEGTLGAVLVAYKASDGNIYHVKVGSGFADFQRDLYWDEPELIINKMIEIESFGESKNAAGSYSLNCPIFKRIVGDV